MTKSRLIERDIDLLVEIARRNTLVVHVTITTPDAELARLLEPRAPRPDLRFQAVKRLRRRGSLRVSSARPCCLELPTIRGAGRLARRAAAAGASFLAAHPLFLKPCSRPTYLSFVREHFPLCRPTMPNASPRPTLPGRSIRAACGDGRSRCRRYGLGKRSSDALLTRARRVGGSRRKEAASHPEEALCLEIESGEDANILDASGSVISGRSRRPRRNAPRGRALPGWSARAQCLRLPTRKPPQSCRLWLASGDGMVGDETLGAEQMNVSRVSCTDRFLAGLWLVGDDDDGGAGVGLHGSGSSEE